MFYVDKQGEIAEQTDLNDQQDYWGQTQEKLVKMCMQSNMMEKLENIPGAHWKKPLTKIAVY